MRRKRAHGPTFLGNVEFHEQHQSVVVPGDIESAEDESWCQVGQSLQLHKTVPSELGMNSRECRALGCEVHPLQVTATGGYFGTIYEQPKLLDQPLNF